MKELFSTNISKNQCRDTGMAVVLLLLLLGLFLQNLDFVKIAIAALILTMTIPMVFKYPAILWFGLSQLIGTIVSKLLLTLVFFFVVTPVGLVRRIMGYDSLKLKEFGKNNESVMHIRNKTFKKNDINKPY
jgi:hypothetical protein